MRERKSACGIKVQGTTSGRENEKLRRRPDKQGVATRGATHRKVIEARGKKARPDRRDQQGGLADQGGNQGATQHGT